MKELKNDSDIIVLGTVVDVQYFDFNTNTFTKSKVQVEKSFNGKVKKGDYVNVIEIGGLTTKGNLQKYDPEKINIPENELNDTVKVILDGAPLTVKGDKVVVFAKEDTENFFQLNEKAYIILNSYQGKFNIDYTHNKIKRHHENGEEDQLDLTLTNFEKQVTE